MTGLELERAVEGLAGACGVCSSLHARLGFAHGELHATARRAARRQSPDNLAACRLARAGLAQTRAVTRDHLYDTHQMKEAKAS